VRVKANIQSSVYLRIFTFSKAFNFFLTPLRPEIFFLVDQFSKRASWYFEEFSKFKEVREVLSPGTQLSLSACLWCDGDIRGDWPSFTVVFESSGELSGSLNNAGQTF